MSFYFYFIFKYPDFLTSKIISFITWIFSLDFSRFSLASYRAFSCFHLYYSSSDLIYHNDKFTSYFYFIYVSCMRLLFVRFDSNIFIFFLLVYSLCLRIFILLNKDAFATYTFLKSWIACWRRTVEDRIFSCFLYFYSDIEEKYNNKINPPRSILRIEFFAGKSNLNYL